MVSELYSMKTRGIYFVPVYCVVPVSPCHLLKRALIALGEESMISAELKRYVPARKSGGGWQQRMIRKLAKVVREPRGRTPAGIFRSCRIWPGIQRFGNLSSDIASSRPLTTQSGFDLTRIHAGCI